MHQDDSTREGSWPADPACVSAARHLVTDALDAWRMPGLRDAAASVTAELAANAVLHARTPFDLSVQRLPDGLLLRLHDRSAVLPLAGRVDDASGVSGRGLGMLDELCVSWGAVPDGQGGKSVYALLAEGRSGVRRTP